MKLTKEHLKQIIKEELSTLEPMREGSLQMRDMIDGMVKKLADAVYGGNVERAKGELINYLKTGDRSSLEGGM